MSRKTKFLYGLGLLALCVTSGSPPSAQAQQGQLKIIGHSSLTGEAAARQAQSDKVVCASQAQQAAVEMQARVASMRQRQGTGGSTTEFQGRSSNGTTFLGTAETVPNDSSALYLGPGLGGLWEGRRHAELDALPRQAAEAAAMKCLSDRGWLFGYK